MDRADLKAACHAVAHYHEYGRWGAGKGGIDIPDVISRIANTTFHYLHTRRKRLKAVEKLVIREALQLGMKLEA